VEKSFLPLDAAHGKEKNIIGRTVRVDNKQDYLRHRNNRRPAGKSKSANSNAAPI